MKKETTKSVSEVFVSPSNLSVCSIGMVVVFCAALLLHTVLRVLSPESVVAQEESSVSDSDWTAEMQAVQGKLPSQSHAMRDVAYHFANLWFAAQAENWPLADFYLNETKSHLHWAVRIIPIRKDLQGEDVDLGGILESVENTQLAWMEEAVANHDKNRFEETYRLTIEACYACHKASGKPYLRPKIPDNPLEPMIEFSPEAEWPK